MTPLLGQVTAKLESIGTYQQKIRELEQQAQNHANLLQKEKERVALAQSNAERRYEALKSDMRESMRKEQELEDLVETLKKEKRQYEERMTEIEGKKAESANSMRVVEETRDRLKSWGVWGM